MLDLATQRAYVQPMNEVKHTDSKGNTKYYASYKSAWNAANKLNDKNDTDGIWLFEADMTGWYVFLAPHGSER